MRNAIVKLFVILSAVIGVAVVAETFRSCSHQDSVAYTTAVGADGNSSVSLMSYYGRVVFCHWRSRFAPEGRDRYVRSDNLGHSDGYFSIESSAEPPLNETTRRGMMWFTWYTTQDKPTGDPNDPV